MKKSSIVFLAMILALITYFLLTISPVLYFGNDVANDSIIRNVMVTGRGGAAGLAPENTIAAIKEGISNGCDRIEVDVRLTKDGTIVCMHDKDIKRTTNGSGLVNNISFAQLRKYSAGIKFSKEFKDEKVPTLEEVLQIIDNQAVLLVEIKDGNELYPEIEKKVVQLINKYNAKKKVIVHSFSDSVLIKINKLDPEIQLHKLFILDFPFFNLLYDGQLRITTLEYYSFVDEFSSFYTFTTKRVIEDIHKLGKKINVWTVNDSTKINRLINLGVDGIITDYPNYLNRNN